MLQVGRMVLYCSTRSTCPISVGVMDSSLPTNFGQSSQLNRPCRWQVNDGGLIWDLEIPSMKMRGCRRRQHHPQTRRHYFQGQVHKVTLRSSPRWCCYPHSSFECCCPCRTLARQISHQNEHQEYRPTLLCNTSWRLDGRDSFVSTFFCHPVS